jgi:hypothetical protein
MTNFLWNLHLLVSPSQNRNMYVLSRALINPLLALIINIIKMLHISEVQYFSEKFACLFTRSILNVVMNDVMRFNVSHNISYPLFIKIFSIDVMT